MAISYQNEVFIKANPYEHNYYHHTHDRWERKVYCGCGKLIGTQIRYSRREKFHYQDVEKNNYNFCPYCGADMRGVE